MKKLLHIFLVALLVKAMYFVFSFFSVNKLDLSVLKKNDSYWYETIALNGHEKITPDQLGKCEDGNIQQSYYAFFPLYPLILGLSIKLTGLTFNAVAFFYSILFSLLLFVYFFKFIRKATGSETTAFNSTLVLILFPFHYYFSVYYTEALFLLLLVGAFYAIEDRKLGLFAILSSLLVLVRPNGLFMLVPLFLFFMEKNHGSKLSNWFKLSLRQYLPFLVFVVPVSVFVMYCSYLWVMTGDFFAYKTAQAGWCRETVWPWVPILRSSGWADYVSSAYLLLFMVIALFQIRKMTLSDISLVWISFLLPLTASSITSPRYISVIFVFSLMFGKWLNKGNPLLNVIIFILLFIFQLVTFQFWITADRFSY